MGGNMPIRDSNITTINHHFHDDVRDAVDNPENDIDTSLDLFKSGPDIPVKIFITSGSISIEFPTLFKKSDDTNNDGDENYISLDDRISITIDYFGDKLRVFHNNSTMLNNPQSFNEQKEVMIIPSVQKFIEENGSNNE